LHELLPALHAVGLSSYLETNGQLPEALEALSTAPHYIAMDYKLPSAAGTPAAWDTQAAFLRAAIQQCERERVGALTLTDRLQIKIVFADGCVDELVQAGAMIATQRTDIPIILQPVTPHPGGPEAPCPQTVLEAQRLLAKSFTTVRVIPQTHVMLKQW
jgi:organic radical activating enzyme